MLTVVDVIRSMGLEPERGLTWSVGAQVRAMYEADTGRLPHKDLRTKTAGGGTHCFAVYPPERRDRIVDVVRRHEAIASRQPKLF